MEIVRQAIQVNVFNTSLRKKGYEFPMKVEAYNFYSQSCAKKKLKAFKNKYELEEYEVVRPMFDLNGYARGVL